MAILRSLSGSGSAALVADMINQYGEDSIFVKMASVMYWSSETTFYVIAVTSGRWVSARHATRYRRASSRTRPRCSSGVDGTAAVPMMSHTT
jgi:spore maturation protein SpmB